MITINVDAYHIEQGRSGEYNRCPIALALFEQGFREINVDEDFVRLQWGNTLLEFTPPREMKLFIDDFDHFRPVKPSTFVLSELRYQPTTKSPGCNTEK